MKKGLGFLDLPGEIRNKIYEYALIDPDGIHLKASKFHCRRQVLRTDPGALRGKHAKPTTYEPLGAGLLATNKKIYQEGLGFLYNRNMFFLQDPYALHTFIVNIGPRMAQKLRDLTVVTWNDDGRYKGYSHSCFTALLFATSIESLRLEMRNMRWEQFERRELARTIYENAFPWLEAVGSAKGNFDAALDILQVDPSTFGTPANRPLTLSPADKDDFIEDFQLALRVYLNRQASKFKTTRKSSK
jgi:hypothetical protein